MSDEIIKDVSGRTLGFVRKMPGRRQQAYDADRRLLGSYDDADNATKDASGRMVAKGDALSGLIFGRRR